MAVRFGLYSPSPQDRTAFTIRTNFTGPEGLDYFHQKCGGAAIYVCCYRCNVAVRFGLYSPSPQDRTAFTIRTNFTGPEGLDYFHQKVWRGCNICLLL